MTHWWKRSLTGQLIGFTLMALVVAQALTFLISWDERSKALLAAAKSEFISRTVSVTRLIQVLPPEFRQQALLASETNYTRFWISTDGLEPLDTWSRRASSELKRPLANFVDFREKLGLSPDRHTGAAAATSVEPKAGSTWVEPSSLLWSFPQQARFMTFDGHEGLGIAIELDSGQWLNTVYHRPHTGSWWSTGPLTSIGITAIGLAVISVFIAARIARPLRRLAVSAEALGRGENLPPLPEKGPDDIRRTAEAFNRMQERLHRFVQDRTRMLAAIGHDLRTPLTSLRLRAEFVSDPDVQEKMLATISELEAMTVAAISFARGESSGEETRAMELDALVGSVCDDLADLGQAVSYAEGPQITYRCRPDGLRRAIRNLLENAVKYAGGAKVYIRHSGATLDIVVEDSGPGIPDEMKASVFEPFVRLEASRNRDTGGVGLGLSIVRAVARQHGGDVTLKDNDPGLRAIISLPAESAAASGKSRKA
ncbi:ATP-binding protein [Rhizobium halophytocola]|uniref:histidine kinase n=1 Tax=Rhizobium halophytocola TaxID=735519 RepID=A0ABS4E0R3_9HYPH|nr:ATP-binding protein [Rhizobium halophytocola]MBP1851530.1 signal transduction histidine kinase [Rhizobium halophytocola]